MTRNQIAYQTLVETKANNARVATENERSNRAKETETERSNRARESLTRDQNTETHRANTVREGLTAQQNAETERANRARESNLADVLLETRRANLAREAETSRSNRARETETARSNRANEAEAYRSHSANERESVRSHMMNEQLTSQQLFEQGRHNLVQEQLSSELNAIRQGELSETERANLAREGIQADQLEKDLKALDQEWLMAVMNVKSREDIAALQRELDERIARSNLDQRYTQTYIDAVLRVLDGIRKLIPSIGGTK